MDKLYIIAVDDQEEVLRALEDDLSFFLSHTEVEMCTSGVEVLELIDELDRSGDHLAVLVSDHVMPKMTGVELLSKIQQDGRFTSTQKLLLTGLASHQDTIDAINHAGLDMYIAKPWKKADLIEKIKVLITQYLISRKIPHEKFMPILDQETLYAELRNRTI
ncbi:MAG: response regulator [Bacteroidota bacterium]